MAAFWAPEFGIDTRADGVILMHHRGEAPRLAASIPARIKHFAETTPEATAIAERVGDGWRRVAGVVSSRNDAAVQMSITGP